MSNAMRTRLDSIVIGILTCGFVVLLAASADREIRRPVALTADPVATLAPPAVPTGGWWDQISATPAPLPNLPGLPSLGLGGASAGGGGVAVPFSLVSCPGPTVRITAIVTAEPPGSAAYIWNVYGTAASANLEYWKAELAASSASAAQDMGQGWTLLYRSATPVVDGLLIEFNTQTVPKGGYQLRLLAVDKTGNYGEPCTARITTQ